MPVFIGRYIDPYGPLGPLPLMAVAVAAGLLVGALRGPPTCDDGSALLPPIGHTCPSTGVCASVSAVVETSPRLVVRGECGGLRYVAVDHTLSLAAPRRKGD